LKSLHCTSEFLGVTLSFQAAFSKRSLPYFLAVTLPWIVYQGQRTVRSLLRGASLRRHEASLYRFFSHFKFRVSVFRRLVFDLIVNRFALREILIVVDDTLCPKWGRMIFGTGRFFDHVARPRPGFIWGHNWVVLAVVVPLFGAQVALPFWVALYRPRTSCEPCDFRTRHQLVVEALKSLRSWTNLPIRLVADGAYNNESILTPIRELGIPLVSRLRADASLRANPPMRPRKRRGRRAKYGHALPRLTAMRRSNRGWRRVKVHIYSKEVSVDIKSLVAWWPKAAQQLHVVITRDPRGKRKGAILSSTDISQRAEDIVETFARRWSIEQLFADAKQALGLDSAEVRSERSVERHATFAFGLVTMVRVWACDTMQSDKNSPKSFAGQLSLLREQIIANTIFAEIPNTKGSRRNSESLAKLVLSKVPA